MAPAPHLIKHQHLGSLIRQARKDAALSHDRLAERAGTSRSHLIKLEKGWHRPSAPMLEAIARETGKDIEFFQTQTDPDDDEEAALGRFTTDDLVRALMERANSRREPNHVP